MCDEKNQLQRRWNSLCLGMSLDEFKNALASEATIENEKLKSELETLKGKSSTKINVALVSCFQFWITSWKACK